MAELTWAAFANTKDDELRFMVEVARLQLGQDPYGRKREWPRDIIRELDQAGRAPHYKRAHRMLEKWADRRWYEYGVTLDLGWLTAEGLEAAQMFEALLAARTKPIPEYDESDVKVTLIHDVESYR